MIIQAPLLLQRFEYNSRPRIGKQAFLGSRGEKVSPRQTHQLDRVDIPHSRSGVHLASHHDQCGSYGSHAIPAMGNMLFLLIISLLTSDDFILSHSVFVDKIKKKSFPVR